MNDGRQNKEMEAVEGSPTCESTPPVTQEHGRGATENHDSNACKHEEKIIETTTDRGKTVNL